MIVHRIKARIAGKKAVLLAGEKGRVKEAGHNSDSAPLLCTPCCGALGGDEGVRRFLLPGTRPSLDQDFHSHFHNFLSSSLPTCSN